MRPSSYKLVGRWSHTCTCSYSVTSFLVSLTEELYLISVTPETMVTKDRPNFAAWVGWLLRYIYVT